MKISFIASVNAMNLRVCSKFLIIIIIINYKKYN